jgi:hypothetical protein
MPPFEGVESFDPFFVPPRPIGNKKGNSPGAPVGNDWVTARRGNGRLLGYGPGGKR